MPCNLESFFDYINKRGIEQLKAFSTFEEDFEFKTQGEVLTQLKTLSTFHKRSMGYDGYIVQKLNNNIGKIFENFKVDVKRFRRDLKVIENKDSSELNKVEEVFKIYGKDYLNRAEKVISTIEEYDYYKLILRSMRRNEISLYNCGMDNLRSAYIVTAPLTLGKKYEDDNSLYRYFRGNYLEFAQKETLLQNTTEFIQVVNLDRCAYNLVEVDCYYLLNYLRKKQCDYDYKFLVNAFCYFEGLDENSEKFILSLLSYPSDFMRWVHRYREQRKKWSVDKYADKFNKIIEKEVESLI